MPIDSCFASCTIMIASAETDLSHKSESKQDRTFNGLHSHWLQQLLDALGTAKDVGDNVGIIAGTLYDYLPIWALLVWGSAQNLLGYGGLWLAASGRAPKPPFWLACVLICVGEPLTPAIVLVTV